MMMRWTLLLLLLAPCIHADMSKAKLQASLVTDMLKRNGYVYKGVKGDYLKNGKYKIYHTYCYSGNSYAVVGSSDSGISDLDVIVYDKDWKKVVADDDYQAITTVKFFVRKTGLYHIITRAYAGEGYFTQVVAWK